jgi:putative heme degradation protein
VWLIGWMLHRTEPNDPGSSLAGNPLVASVLRENVQLSGGRATIGLWGSWPFLLGEVPSFGRVLTISRNSYAVLGSIAEYPEVVSVPCGNRGRAVDGSLEFDFACWQRGVAIVESRPGGSLYAVEFSDCAGEVVHKICLTEESDFEAFRGWVELNQACGGEAECEGMRHASWLENALLLSASGAEVLRVEALSICMQLVTAKRLEFQVIAENDAAVQAVRIAPTGFCKNVQWIFAGDETSGVHVRIDRLAEVYLDEVGESLALKACDPEGHLVCALVAADETDAGAWNKQLREIAEDVSRDQR